MVRKQKANWPILYLTVPFMLTLLVIEGHIPYSLVLHRIAEFGIVLVSFGLMLLWIRANEAVLVHDEIEKEAWILDDSAANTAFDAALLSLEENPTDSEAHRLEVSPTEGRYN